MALFVPKVKGATANINSDYTENIVAVFPSRLDGWSSACGEEMVQSDNTYHCMFDCYTHERPFQ